MRTRRGSMAVGILIVAAFVLVRGGTPAVARQGAQAPAAAPRLIVLMAIDQFPSEYIPLYGSQWTRGLRRLIDEGALFTEAAYPYGATATCAGHATIGTGAYPQRHGMVGNQWYDRALDKTVQCEEDQSARPLPFGPGTLTVGNSAAHMMVPALADQLARQSSNRARIVSVAEKARSAIGLGGHGGPNTVVAWRGGGTTWSTSSAFTDQPWTDVAGFVQRNPMTAAYGQAWTRLLPESAYRFVDDDPAEPTPVPWGRTFPHVLESPKGVPDGAFATSWIRSPFADAFVVDLAIEMLKVRELGKGPGTDMLALSLGSLDQAGHQYGPRSHEVQDVLARADLAIGRLLDALDEQVGPGNYVLGWSADHGVARIPEQVLSEGGQAGRLGPLGALTTSLLQWTLGRGRYVGLADGTQVAFTPEALQALEARADVKQLLMSTLATSPGVAKVFDRAMLAGTDPTGDADLQAWRLSYMADRSGDIAVVMKPGWVYGNDGANHGTQNPYDQRVPVLLFGAGIRKGHYTTTASPADLAPTLARIAGIALPDAQGRVLAEALP